MKVGFTGTRHGMTGAQVQALTRLLIGFQNSSQSMVALNEFHHGDCVGADAQAVAVARGLYWKTHSHPPDEGRKRAWTSADVLYQPKPYLVRNKDIVDLTEVLVAVPKEYEEIVRSGTWSTVRYAAFAGRITYLIQPDGNVAVLVPPDGNVAVLVPPVKEVEEV